MTAAKFKANFSSVVDDLIKGNEVVITYGRAKITAMLILDSLSY